ncbi:hypothetical protein [Litoreibacter albidus]|uniref:hypothetical protein n=1 Tax=Litoreibacter albidus TaxID=670155 RepID=UPI0037351C1D
MISKRNLIWLCAIGLVVVTIVAAIAQRPSRAITLGMLHDVQDLEKLSLNYNFPNIVERVHDDGFLSTLNIPSFTGPTTLLVEGTNIEFPKAWTRFETYQGYVVGFNLLEVDGRYTREEAARQFVRYADIVKAVPNVIYIKGAAQELSGDALYERIFKSLERFHPKGIYGSRKLGVLKSNLVTMQRGKAFKHGFDINVLYDESSPKKPYSFAFRAGLNARSRSCLLQLDAFFRFGPDQDGVGIDPVLLEIFEGWDRNDIADETLKPLIDEYVFEKCTQDIDPLEDSN